MPLDPEIQAIVDKAVETAVAAAVNTTRTELKGLFDDATDGLKKNKDEAVKRNSGKADRITELEAENKRLKDSSQADRLYDKFMKGQLEGQPNHQTSNALTEANAVLVNRDGDRSVKQMADGTLVFPADVSSVEYQALKAVVQKNKVKFVQPGRQSTPVYDETDNVKIQDFEVNGRRYVSKQFVSDHGGNADGRLGTVITFKHLTDLPADALAKHDELAKGGDDA